MPKMPYEIPDKPIKVRGRSGEEHIRRLFPRQTRLKEIAKSVTSLINRERIKLSYFRAYETRNYTERVLHSVIALFNYIIPFTANCRSYALWGLSQAYNGTCKFLFECKITPFSSTIIHFI